VTYIFTDPVSVHEAVVSAFVSPQSIQETLNTLCEASTRVSDRKKEMEVVCQFLERLFSETFKGCKTHPFGSRISGLASSHSDLDVFLDTGNNNTRFLDLRFSQQCC
jgi:DNA polymerase sigma